MCWKHSVALNCENGAFDLKQPFRCLLKTIGLHERFLDVIKNIGTPLVAVCGVFIAHKFGKIQAAIAQQQANTAALSVQTARNKLKLDLFDRRLTIYNTVTTMLGQLGMTGNLSSDDERNYLVGINGAHWLFDVHVVAFLEKTIWHQMINFVLLQRTLRDPDQWQNLKNVAELHSAARKTLLDQRAVLDEIFDPYLKLET